MPRYEYRCRECNRTFEEVHGVNDTVESCRFCDGGVRRVFHPVGIVLKGSGFYTTDSRESEKTPSPDEKKGPEEPSAPDKTEKREDKRSEDTVKARP